MNYCTLEIYNSISIFKLWQNLKWNYFTDCFRSVSYLNINNKMEFGLKIRKKQKRIIIYDFLTWFIIDCVEKK